MIEQHTSYVRPLTSSLLPCQGSLSSMSLSREPWFVGRRRIFFAFLRTLPRHTPACVSKLFTVFLDNGGAFPRISQSRIFSTFLHPSYVSLFCSLINLWYILSNRENPRRKLFFAKAAHATPSSRIFSLVAELEEFLSAYVLNRSCRTLSYGNNRERRWVIIEGGPVRRRGSFTSALG